jgi:hypothetical protein
MSEDSLERNRISPIQMKSGSEVSAQPQLESQSVEAISEPIGAAVKSPIITMPTVSSESATQTPLASSRRREAARTSEARTVVSIIVPYATGRSSSISSGAS